MYLGHYTTGQKMRLSIAQFAKTIQISGGKVRRKGKLSYIANHYANRKYNYEIKERCVYHVCLIFLPGVYPSPSGNWIEDILLHVYSY